MATTAATTATAARRPRRSSASPTASSTTGPAPTSCARRWPMRRAAARRRQYCYRDLLELKVIKNLLDAGIKLESVRDAFDYLRDHLGEDVTTPTWSSAATARCSCTTARRSSTCSAAGQGVLNILPLGRRQGRGRRRHRRALPASRRAGPAGPRPAHRRSGSSTPAAARWLPPLDAEALAARRAAPRARREDGPVRWLGHAAAVRHGHPGRAPGLPQRRGGVRRQPPRHRARAGARRVRRAAGGVHQRPGPHRPRPGAVHPPARPGRCIGARRHHRVVGRRPSASTSCPTRRTPIE